MSVNLFAFLKNRVPILEVINHYTTIKKTGNYWKGSCPFHSERTASFTVSPDKNIFYCFGCHTGGDVIAFIAKVENLSPLQAVHYLAEQYSVALPEQEQNKKNFDQNFQEKKQYWHLCSLVAQWCHAQLLKSPQALAYFKQRQVNQSIMTMYMLGYFPSGQRALKSLLDFVKPHNYLAHDLIQAHIVAEGKGHLYSPFEDRLIFPIKDFLGRFCGFGGRVFLPSDERSKYYNSKENSNFLKGSLLFGFDLAKAAIQKHEAAFLVEGYTDCITMVQHGFNNTIATLGTACTLEHLKNIARYACTLYVIYDGDQAGQNAIVRLTELCWQVNVELKVVQLPLNEDPASFLSKGGNLLPLIDQAQDIFSFFITKLGMDFSKKNLQEKIRLTQQLLKVIASIEEPIKQDFLLQAASKNCDIPLESLKKELARLSSPERKEKSTEPSSDKSTQAPLSKNSECLKTISELEKKLFSVIINNMAILKEEDWHFIEYFSEPLQDILNKIKHSERKDSDQDFALFFELLDPAQKDLVTKLLLEFQEYVHEKNFNQLFIQFQRQHWKTLVAVFKIKLAKAEQAGDKNLVQKLLHDFQKFKKKLVINRGAHG